MWIMIGTVLMSCWIAVSPADAGEALDFVKAMQEQYLQVLRDPTLQSKDKQRELNDRLRDLAMPVLDVDEMAKRALAKHWSLITHAEQTEFIEVFRNYLGASNRLPTRFYTPILVLEREKIEQEFAEVEGYFYLPDKNNAPVVYRLHLVGATWKVYDSSLRGVSSVEVLRAQFTRVIAKSSFRGLINTLRERTEEMEKEIGPGK
jgi:phospholipid transport system substrate-binding protein